MCGLHGDGEVDQVGVLQLGTSLVIWIHDGDVFSVNQVVKSCRVYMGISRKSNG